MFDLDIIHNMMHTMNRLRKKQVVLVCAPSFFYDASFILRTNMRWEIAILPPYHPQMTTPPRYTSIRDILI